MRKIRLYIAISLDGKIADAAGKVDWLDELPNPDKDDYGYFEFIKSIDTTLMGNSTYQQVLTFPVPFPYTDQKNYVFTGNEKLKHDERVTFLSGDIVGTIRKLKEEPGKDIWLIGGAKANTLLQEAGLIDEYLVFVMPIILGEGIPLFSEHSKKAELKLIQSKSYTSGVTFLNYSKI